MSTVDRVAEVTGVSLAQLIGLKKRKKTPECLCHQRRLWNVGGTYRILGEFLLISSLPGKALRTLVDIARLAERFNMRSQSRAR